MQQMILGATLSVVGLLASSSSFAQGPQGRRQVQLLTMGSAGPPSAGELIAEDVRLAARAPNPDAFRVHDLSRQYVEFQMSEEMRAMAASAAAAESIDPYPAIAPVSAIVVPDWMKAGRPSVSPLPFSPGCAPAAYRSSGILGRAAEARRAAYFDTMSTIACEHGIPTGLFDALIIQESAYNPIAVSPKNAFGFAQLMPATAVGLGVDRYDPIQNMRGGARYLRQQLDRFGQVRLALAAYNVGPGRVRNGHIPAITETQNYVRSIIANWSQLIGARAAVTHATPINRQDRREADTRHF